MKRAFTLIELLAVIIILAVIALIATPVVLKVVDSAKSKADFESANGIVDSARLYFAESMLDGIKQIKIDNLDDIYEDLVLNNKPEFGQLYVNNKGHVAMAIIINDKCYKKEFMGEIVKTEVSDCDLGYIGIDTTPPTINQEVISSTINENGWYKEDIYIKINITDSQSGVAGYRRCISQVECEPNEDIHTNNNIIVTTESVSNYVCVIGVDKYGNESEKNCEVYKLDKMIPILTAKTENIEITVGDNIEVSSYFNEPIYGVSGGSLNCNPTNTIGLTVGNQSVSCTATGNNGLITTANKTITVKEDIYTDNSGANIPELYDKMIPVKWNGSNWVYADISDKWYDYDLKEWANAVVLEPGKVSSVGQTINMSDIAMMYVWIPRYKYTIFNGNNSSVSMKQINITFENQTEKTGTISCSDAINQVDSSSNKISEICNDVETGSIVNNTSTYTHPAFTFGDKELTGIWVGKFEVSTTDDSCNNFINESNCDKSTHTIIIKPNLSSIRYITGMNLFYSILDIKTKYSMNDIDTHMIKNMEWGAAAYLTNSKYGRCTSGICEEVIFNNIINSGGYSNSGTTGCAADSVNASTVTTCASTNTYETLKGIKASTTGNIYGIYDMSGGAYEITMGTMLGSNGKFYSSLGFMSAPAAKYFEKYTYDGSSYTTHSRGKLGDATKEILQSYGSKKGGWYINYSELVGVLSPWFLRGGYANISSGAGIFSFFTYDANGNNITSSRAVIVSK